jgi:hypothetical protein
MRIFQKTHFWKDKRTFLDAEGDLAKLNERGYAEDGSVSIRIGDEEGMKAAFKMTIDEVRALRDVIDGFIRMNDRTMIKLFRQVRDRRSGNEERRSSGEERRISQDDRSYGSPREEYRSRDEGYVSQRDDYEPKRKMYDSDEPRIETVEVEPAQFSIFDNDDKKREEPKVKYYY